MAFVEFRPPSLTIEVDTTDLRRPTSAPSDRTHTPMPSPERQEITLTPTRRASWEKMKTKMAVEGGRDTPHTRYVAMRALSVSPPHLAPPSKAHPIKQALKASYKIQLGVPYQQDQSKPGNSNWILPNLLMGGYPIALGKKSGNRCKLQIIVKVCDADVTAVGTKILPDIVKKVIDLNVPGGRIFDYLLELTRGDIESLMIEIAEGLLDNKLTYIHCLNGETRSGAMTAMFVMWLYDLTPRQALAYVTLCRPKTDQGILQDLKDFHLFLCPRK